MGKETTSKTTEERVSQTILEQPTTIKVGSKEYTVAPPSIATLILVSAAVSTLPRVSLDEKKLIEDTLHIAKDCAAIGNIMATFILGAKHVNDQVTRIEVRTVKYLQGLFKRKVRVEVSETKREQLSRELLEELSPRELQAILANLLTTMEIGDFFGLTTFLLEVNTIRPTKVVNQTAYGQQ